MNRHVTLLVSLCLAVAGKAGLLTITTSHLSPEGLVVAGSGGSSDSVFWVLTATNPFQSASEWSVVATNQAIFLERLY